MMQVFREFRYLAIRFDQRQSALLHARVGERDLEGVISNFDANGLVQEFSVMVRPYLAATALREIVAAHLAEGN